MLTIELTHRPMSDNPITLTPPLIHALHARVVEARAVGTWVDRHYLDTVGHQFIVHCRADAFDRVLGGGIRSIERHFD
ncbi:hypothetical protein D3C85_1404040 [compost metagenome]